MEISSSSKEKAREILRMWCEAECHDTWSMLLEQLIARALDDEKRKTS